MSKAEVVQLKQKIAEERPKLGEIVPQTKQYAPRKLDIASGTNVTPGFKGIDIGGTPDIKHDLFQFPWPIKANSVQEVVCNHFLEHIPHYRPEFNGTDGFFMFFNELYRIMRKGGTALFRHPYVWNDRAFWDPTHVRFIHEMNYYYLSKDWREQQKLGHYDATCDFEVLTVSFAYTTTDLQTRPPEYQEWARTHLKNAVSDLEVTLKKL